MSSLVNIPPKYHEGFRLLSTMEDDTFQSLIEAIKLTSLTSSVKRLSSQVAISENLPLKDIEAIFMGAGSLTGFIEKGSSTVEIAEGIATISDDNSIIDFSKVNSKDVFVVRLSTLLETERLYYAAKASIVMNEYENVFIQARIVTDIRPIFGIKVDELPKSGMIIHNLHIHFRKDEEGDHRDIYFALDSNDLKILQELLSRAQQKENSLNAVLKNANMINLNE